MAYRIVLLLTAAMLLAPLAGAHAPINQVRNPSLEDWNASNTVPDRWTVEIGDVIRSDFRTDGDWAAQLRAKPNPDGSHLSILAQTVPNNQLPGSVPEDEKDLPIVPGQFYEFNFDAAGIYNGKGSGMATVTWTGVLGNTLRVDTIPIPEATAYESFEAHLQAPVDPTFPDAAGSATIRFVVDGQSSDEKVNLWVDNVSFGLSTPGVPGVPGLPPLPEPLGGLLATILALIAGLLAGLPPLPL